MPTPGIRRATKLATTKARHKFHRHAVLLMSGRRILASAWNHGGTHAEKMGLAHAGDAARGADVLSIRIRHSGQLGLARPCAKCWAALKKAGVRRVQWSTNDGTFVTETI
jgi:pyrimidine deaminase RibD-like protein